MQAGIHVRSAIHPEKGVGVVLGAEKFFDEVYVDVFFEKTGERRTLSFSDLVTFREPPEKMRAGRYSPAPRFILRLLMEKIRAENNREGLRTAGNFKILPLPHQLLAVSFVLDQFKTRALIADEVGLGKTIEAALIYEELKARGMVKRVLVIAPAGLCPQWRDEMKAKFGEDFVVYERETILSLKKLHGEKTNVWSLADRIITSLDYVKPKQLSDDLDDHTARMRRWHNEHVFSAMVEAGFDAVIFDEAHKLTKGMSGEETARYKVSKALAGAAPVLLLLTATPHQGDPYKFKNLLWLIDPYLFTKNSDVTAENVRQVTVRNNKRAAIDFNGNRLFKQRIVSLYLIQRDKARDNVERELYRAVTDYVTAFYELATRQNNRMRKEFEAKEDEYMKAVGELTMDLNFLKKMESVFGPEERKEMIEWKEPEKKEAKIAINKQCQLLSISRSTAYYKPLGPSNDEIRIKNLIDRIYTAEPTYGARRISNTLKPISMERMSA